MCGESWWNCVMRGAELVELCGVWGELVDLCDVWVELVELCDVWG